MCIIIDTNTFSIVFDETCKDHKTFKPVKDWIIDGKGKIIYGGTKFKKELMLNMIRFRRLFKLLTDCRKIVEVPAEIVDSIEIEVRKKEKNPDFDDQHLVALFIASGCKIFCSNDKRADKFIKDKKFYPNTQKPPLIYRSLKHAIHLNDEKITELCKPEVKLNKSQKVDF